MLIVAIEFIGDKLPRIDDVYQPIMTSLILPNVTNANQTGCQSTDCLFERSMTCFMVCSRGMVYRIGQIRRTVLSGVFFYCAHNANSVMVVRMKTRWLHCRA